MGLYMTFMLRGLQFSHLVAALRLGLFKRHDADSEGDISQYQALAALVGTGNTVGVATAIACFGIGNLTQANAIAANVQSNWAVPIWGLIWRQ